MNYTYKGLNSAGKSIKGEIEAKNLSSAKLALKEKAIYLIEINESKNHVPKIKAPKLKPSLNKNASLRSCKDCGEKVSKKASACPKCGAPLKRKTLGAGSFILIIIILGTFIALVPDSDFSDIGNKTPVKTKTVKKDWREQNNSSMAYIMVQDFVEQRLKAPKSADFPGAFDSPGYSVDYLGNQSYIIKAYVDSQNSFGANLRTHFVGEIKQKDETNWQLISLELF